MGLFMVGFAGRHKKKPGDYVRDYANDPQLFDYHFHEIFSKSVLFFDTELSYGCGEVMYVASQENLKHVTPSRITKFAIGGDEVGGFIANNVSRDDMGIHQMMVAVVSDPMHLKKTVIDGRLEISQSFIGKNKFKIKIPASDYVSGWGLVEFSAANSENLAERNAHIAQRLGEQEGVISAKSTLGEVSMVLDDAAAENMRDFMREYLRHKVGHCAAKTR